MKKNIYFILILLTVLGCRTSVAQNDTYEGDITVNPVRLEQRGDFLYVDMDIILNGVKVRSPQGVVLTPQLITPEHTYDLPEVLIKGLDNYKSYGRKLSVMNKKEKAAFKEPYTVKKASGRTTDNIAYRYMLPYEEWMANARLDVQYDKCGCGNLALMDVHHITDKVTLEPLLIPYVVTPYMAYVQPAAEEIKRREMQAESFLDFEVNKVNIRPEYMNNPRELAKIHAMIDELRNDAGVKVNHLSFIGYASPEGTLAGNKRLSEGRAHALRDYMASRYNFPRDLYSFSFGGENWEGLLRAVSTMDMDYKNEVLDILNNTSDTERRKEQLKQLRGGVPYRYLLQNVYPALRVAICKANYEVRNFNVEEAREIIKKRPQNLSLSEMFLVANSYPAGSQEFVDVFETAVRMFPEDEVANLNAAAAALLRNDLVSAERYLGRLDTKRNLPEYENTLGVYHLLRGDYDQAKIYLDKAAAAGLEPAKLNLEELNKKKENIIQIETKNQ